MQKMNRNRYLKTKNSNTGEIPQDLGLNVIKNNINYIVKAIVNEMICRFVNERISK